MILQMIKVNIEISTGNNQLLFFNYSKEML